MMDPGFAETPATILCCLCGTPMPANPSNMCLTCLRSQRDITEGIPKQLVIHYCKECERYLNPPNHWITAGLESRELLTFCLKRIRGLNKVKLVDAGFIWTEPHSRRLKVRCVVQAEVFNGAILQQEFVVEFVVATQQCDQCSASYTEHTWKALVQVRQKVDHKRTFYFLEQLILKHKAHAQCINVKERADGIDFYYSHRSHAQKMVEFLGQVAPTKYKTSERLISTDIKSNVANFKYTFSVEIVPLCRDDMVILPIKLARQLGNISPLCLVASVSNVIHLVDPSTLQVVEMQPMSFWKSPFRPIGVHKRLIEFTVLDTELLGPTRGRHALADVQVARSADFGVNDTTFITRTHLGNLLQPGDFVLGYDTATANYNDQDMGSLKHGDLPDVVLVRKTYPARRRVRRNRTWGLERMATEVDDGTYGKRALTLEKQREMDYEQFMQDLEEDPTLRQRVNLFRDPAASGQAAMPATALPDGEEVEEDFPEVQPEELLDPAMMQANAAAAAAAAAAAGEGNPAAAEAQQLALYQGNQLLAQLSTLPPAEQDAQFAALSAQDQQLVLQAKQYQEQQMQQQRH